MKLWHGSEAYFRRIVDMDIAKVHNTFLGLFHVT